MKPKFDTRAVGLDAGLALGRWLTGDENLHYGLWDDLPVCAGNMGAAQQAWTALVLRQLPPPPASVLDIGGGAGVLAGRLLAAGYGPVDIVIPSAALAARCRVNAPAATVHETRFEDFDTDARFDVCLFAESFQYIPLMTALEKARALLRPGGQIVIADCFRTRAGRADDGTRKVGAGHPEDGFRDAVARMGLEIVAEQDITASVAPSVEVEQGFYNALGTGLARVDQELQRARPRLRGVLQWGLRRALSPRRRARLGQRLFETTRTPEAFCENNRYLVVRLRVR